MVKDYSAIKFKVQMYDRQEVMMKIKYVSQQRHFHVYLFKFLL